VRFHLFLAGIVVLHAALLASLVLVHARSVKPLAGLASLLFALVLTQIALGAGTWIVKFSVPAWASSIISTGAVAVQDGGWLQTHIITAHVAVGSLLLASSLALALYAQRLLPSAVATAAVPRRLGAAV
jgi:cytochrome c oxidase assembly protein subunit 15